MSKWASKEGLPDWADLGLCPACGKKIYPSKKAAKAAARAKHPGDRQLVPYPCRSKSPKRPTPPPWHFGHLADEVKRGPLSRAERYEAPPGPLRAPSLCAYADSGAMGTGLRCSLEPDHVGRTPHLALTASGEWVNIDPKAMNGKDQDKKEGQSMAPTISETARITTHGSDFEVTEVPTKSSSKSSTSKSKAKKAVTTKTGRHLFQANPAHEQMFASITKILEDAYLLETAPTSTELWFRADFSGFTKENLPSFTAFNTYLRHQVNKGRLIMRKETVDEREVRKGKRKAPFNRFANLYALPVANVVPTVTKTFDSLSPLTDEQKEWASEHPALRDRPKPKPKAVKQPEPEAQEEKIAEPIPMPKRQPKPEPEPQVAVMDDAGTRIAALQGQVAELRQENGQLRTALGQMAETVKIMSGVAYNH